MANEVQTLVKRLKAADYEVEDTKTGYRVKGPKGLVTFHKTPSDSRWLKNVTADLRRMGIELNGTTTKVAATNPSPEVPAYYCTEHKKGWNDKKEYVNHLLTHQPKMGEKSRFVEPWQCPLCQFNTTWAPSKNKHLHSHLFVAPPAPVKGIVKKEMPTEQMTRKGQARRMQTKLEEVKSWLIPLIEYIEKLEQENEDLKKKHARLERKVASFLDDI